MCGIVGIAGKKISHSNIDRMLSTMKYRGPDGNGKWSSDDFSYGHLRLSIIDLSDKAAQPMICNQTGNVIVFNGEIYNFVELKNELKDEYRFSSHSDTEVILAAYLKWGTDCFNKLRGMFALSIWDKSKNEIIIARDRFGIKPLYYRFGESYFLFGSEIKTILNIDYLKHSINELKILEYLCSRQQDCNEETMFAEIFQVLPGHFMKVDSFGRIKENTEYYKIPEQFGQRKVSPDSLNELKEEIKDSVTKHLISDVPVGAFVSGGLDSSTISCLAASVAGNENINLFSSILKNSAGHTENSLIPKIQEKLGGPKFEIMIDDMPFLDNLKEVVYHHDEPIGDASMYAHYELCRLASKNGIKVLLSGSGGDEVFGGYPSHSFSYLGKLVREGNIPKLISTFQNYSHTRPESLIELVGRSLQESAPYSLRRYMKHQSFKSSVKHVSFGQLSEMQKYYYVENHDPFVANYLNCIKSWTIPPFLHYEDRNSAAFGVETRVPFLDHQLLDFVMTFDSSEFVADSSKSMIRKSMRNIVPDEVLKQKVKHGFPAPLNDFLKKDIKRTAELFAAEISTVPFLDKKKSEKLADDFLNKNIAGSMDIFWRTFCLSIWYNMFF